MSKWQPIETAPKDGTHILAYGWNYNTHDGDEGRQCQREIWRKWNDTFNYIEASDGLYRREPARSNDRWAPDSQFTPTHWMPLPEPPQPL